MQPVTVQKFLMTRENVLEAIADWLRKQPGDGPQGIPVATLRFTEVAPAPQVSLTHLDGVTLNYYSGG